MTAPEGPPVYRDRWALVTGASAGLGTEFARSLARRGMNLVLTARRRERLGELAAELSRSCGVATHVVVADLAQAGAPAALWAAATTGREIDLLVNNAGFGAQGPLADLALDRQLQMVQLNCAALLELTHLAVGHMKPRRTGGIINVSSLAAFQPVPQLATYAASKSFVLSLSEALHREVRDHGLRVLALCPGRTPTEFQDIAGTGPVDGAFGVRQPGYVVEEGLAALERGSALVVPGPENHLASLLVRVLPRSTVTRVLKRLVSRAARRSA